MMKCRWDEKDLSTLRAMRAEGHTAKQIAERLGRSENSIVCTSFKHGFHARDHHRKRGEKPLHKTVEAFLALPATGKFP